MYRAEEKRIEGDGGKVRRVILDYELKGRAYSDLAKAWKSKSPIEHAQHQAAVAEAYDLPVVDGHMVFPDVRVEYEDRHGELQRLDFELPTENSRPSHIAAKAQAGFRMYAPGALLSGRLRGGRNIDPEITARIFAL